MSGGGHVAKEGFPFDTTVGDKVQIWDARSYWGKPG